MPISYDQLFLQQDNNFRTNVVKINRSYRSKSTKSVALQLLECFRNWDDHLSFYHKQKKLRESAYKKAILAKKAKKQINPKMFTEEELNAINYFNGERIYKFYQNPNLKVNKFDTKDSFLVKMKNPILREKFLETCKNDKKLNKFLNN